MNPRFPLLLLLILMCASLVAAQETPSEKTDPVPISDNSFLIEEAYNQEPGVVQHINTFTRLRGGDWIYSFTQEWPFKSMKHQLSFTFVGQRLGAPDGGRGAGDTAINYRYQLLSGKESRVAISPRLSLCLPTGSVKRGLGAGGVGIQTNLPISVVLSRKVVMHWNAGGTFTPGAKNTLGQKAFTRGYNLGHSAVWLAHPRFNVLMETAWNSYESVIGRKQTEKSYSLILNPGVRWSHNLKNALQIVPGVAVPLGIGPSKGSRGVFFYLSFEHAFKKILDQ